MMDGKQIANMNMKNFGLVNIVKKNLLKNPSANIMKKFVYQIDNHTQFIKITVLIQVIHAFVVGEKDITLQIVMHPNISKVII